MLVWVFLSMTGSHSYFKALTLIFLCSWCLPSLATLGSNIEGFVQSLKHEREFQKRMALDTEIAQTILPTVEPSECLVTRRHACFHELFYREWVFASFKHFRTVEKQLDHSLSA